MMLRSLLLIGLGLYAPVTGWCDASLQKPNLVVILVDDMGFSDLGCYGSEIPTPNLDALAAGGLKYSQFYNAGRCCPSRASLLTGLYSHQAGMGHMTADEGSPSYRGALNDQCVTLGEVLREAGYFTAHTGKWHVGHRDQSMLPLQRGFDRSYGSPTSNASYFGVKKGRTILSGNTEVYDFKSPPPAGWYSSDAWTAEGLKFIDEALGQKKPFFLYLAHNAPHFPLQATPEDIARHRGKYREGWDKLRQQRHARQLQLGLLENASLSERDAMLEAWDKLDDARRDKLDLRMAIYAAVVERMDMAIGTLVEGLRKRGVYDNTALFFLSDNGASAEGGTYGKFGPGEPGSVESDVYAGQAWANLSDVPFRLYKSYSHEGGISTPLIIHWPAGIKSIGEWRRQVGHVIDIMPTLIELAGASYPLTYKGKPIKPMEGISLTPSFTDQALQRDEALYWEHERNAAVQKNQWKLVRTKNTKDWELYDLSKDRSEMQNLAASHPDKVRELQTLWKNWAQRVGVKPFNKQGSPSGDSGADAIIKKNPS